MDVNNYVYQTAALRSGMYGGLGAGYGMGMGMSPYGGLGMGMGTMAMGMGMYGRSPIMGGITSPYGAAYGSPYGMMGRGVMGGAMMGGGMLGGMGAMGHASDSYTSAYLRGGSAMMPMMM